MKSAEEELTANEQMSGLNKQENIIMDSLNDTAEENGE